MSEQIAMLRAAYNLGIPVSHVELGNEFYLTANLDYIAVFPDAAAYGKVANAFGAAILREFPQATVGAVGASRTGPREGDRMRLWNSLLFSTLNTQLVKALTLHPYIIPGPNLTTGGKRPAGGWSAEAQRMQMSMINSTSGTAGFIGQAAAQFSNWANDLEESGVPASTKLWITEYNLQNIEPVAAYETWAHGMLVASMLLHMLALPQVELALAHTLESNVTQWGAIFTQNDELKHLCCGWGNATTPFTPSAAGYLLGGLATAMANTTGLQSFPLKFSPILMQQAWGVYCGGCTNQSRSYEALQGFAFGRGGGVDAAVVLSMAGRSTVLDITGIFSTGSANAPAVGEDLPGGRLCMQQVGLASPEGGAAQWISGPHSVSTEEQCWQPPAPVVVGPYTLVRFSKER